MIDFNIEIERGYDDDLSEMQEDFVDNFIEEVFG